MTFKIILADGSCWLLSAAHVAEHAARYFCAAGAPEGYSQEQFSEEYNYMLSSPYELEDWLKNCMNWSDVVKHAIKLENKEVASIEELWANATIQLLPEEVK
jgi:hypothetical protein